MSATLKGRAVMWSIGGVTFTGGITGSDFPQSARFSRASEKSEIKDDGGIIRTQVFHGHKKMLSMTVIPADAAAAVSGAQASMMTHQPANGVTVTVVDASGTMVDGTYNLVNSTQNRTVDGVATLDFELEQGDESNDLTTTVA